MKLCKHFLAILLVMVISPNLFGRIISLEQCQQMLIEQNRDIGAAEAEVESAKWKQINAFGNFLPQASFNSTIIRIDEDTYDESNTGFDIPGFGTFPSLMPLHKTTYQNSIVAQQSIFNGGKVIIGYQLARIARKQAELQLQEESNNAVYNGIFNYIQILKLQDLLQLAEKSLAASKSQLQTMTNKEQAGLALKSDVLQWEVKVENDEISVKEIENNLVIVHNIWLNQLNSNDNLEPAPIILDSYISDIEEIAKLTSEQRSEQLTSYISDVKASNPTLKTLDASNLMMQKYHCMSKGNFLPSLNLQFTYEIENDDSFDFDGNDNWNLAAMISLPLFTGGKNFSELKSTAFEKKKVEKETAAAEDDILVAAENSYRTKFILADKIISNRKALESAEENHRLINDYFEQNLVTNTDLLNAETLLYSSQMNLTAAYYDFIIQHYEIKKWVNR